MLGYFLLVFISFHNFTDWGVTENSVKGRKLYLPGVTIAPEDMLGWTHHHKMIGKMSGDTAKLLQLKFPTGEWENGSEMPIKSILCKDICLNNGKRQEKKKSWFRQVMMHFY